MKLNKETVKFLIVHQSATPRISTTFEGIKKFHLYQGMGNIAYHYFVEASGTLKRGRNESTVGTHTKAGHMAERSLGVCVAGNFNTEDPTPLQLKTLAGILKSLAIKYKIPVENILGHREVPGSATECPGDSLNEWLVDFRKELEENLE
jgi:N-acetyl-anhydromuramyl-L-alanine amidase AmpD